MPGTLKFVAIRADVAESNDMDKPQTPPTDDHEWAVRALLSLLRRSREAVRIELLRRAREL